MVVPIACFILAPSNDPAKGDIISTRPKIFREYLSLQPIEPRKCDTAPASRNASSKFLKLSLSSPNLDGIYTQFLKSFGGRPAEADIFYFLDSLSSRLLSREAAKHSTTSVLLEIAFDYRLILSRIQREVCTPAWLVEHYEGFFNQIDTLVGQANIQPTTLEGFLISYRNQRRPIRPEDLRFIDRHMVNSPLNRVIRSSLAAHAVLPVRERVLATAAMCSEFVRIAGEALMSLEASDAAAIGAALEKPNCVSLRGAPTEQPISISPSASFFSALRTNGADVQLAVYGRTVPILDSSVSDRRLVLDPLPKRIESDAAAVPLVVGIRRRTPDGGGLSFRDRFDKIYLIIHAVLKSADDADFDIRRLPTARRGGNIHLLLQTLGSPRPPIAFLSLGQPGATVAVPAEAGAGVESTAPPERLQAFFFGKGADLLVTPGERVLLLVSVTARQLTSLLLTNDSDPRSVPDFVVEVPIAWLEMLNDDQRAALDRFCTTKVVEACLPDLVLREMRRIVRDVFQFCKSSPDVPCDPRKLGVGQSLVLPPGKVGVRRMPGRDGEPGELTVEDLRNGSAAQ